MHAVFFTSVLSRYNVSTSLGEDLNIEIVSPSAVILRPPEKLALEVRTSGRYISLLWRRNGQIAGLSDFNPPRERFVHFAELYVTGNTSSLDLGLYEALLNPDIGQTTSAKADFAVIESG